MYSRAPAGIPLVRVDMIPPRLLSRLKFFCDELKPKDPHYR
jgi:hypothetical protein